MVCAPRQVAVEQVGEDRQQVERPRRPGQPARRRARQRQEACQQRQQHASQQAEVVARPQAGQEPCLAVPVVERQPAPQHAQQVAQRRGSHSQPAQRQGGGEGVRQQGVATEGYCQAEHGVGQPANAQAAGEGGGSGGHVRRFYQNTRILMINIRLILDIGWVRIFINEQDAVHLHDILLVSG